MKPFISAFIALGISALVGYFSFNSGYTTAFDAVLLALMTGILSELTVLLWNVDALGLRNRNDANSLVRHIERIRNLEEQEKLFHEMEKDFAEVRSESHGSKDLFVSHLNSEILALSKKLSDANKRKEMRIKSDYIINIDGVFDSLDVSINRNVRLTYPISTGEPWVGGLSDRRFFEVLLQKVSQGLVNNLSIFFLLEEDVDSKDPNLQKVLQWLNKQTRVQAKYMLCEEFANICSLNGVSTDHLDFGVYGNRMVFRTTAAGPEHEGIYSKDQALVERYRNVFDQMWVSENLALSPQAADDAVKRIGLAEICNFAPPRKMIAIKEK